MQWEAVKVLIALSLVLWMYLVYLWINRSHTYWSRKGVYQLPPHWLLGNVRDLNLGKISSKEYSKYVYREMQNRGVTLLGIYNFYEPLLVVKDIDLMRRILHTDFEYFSDRGSFCNEKVEPHSGHVANVTGDRWKYLRRLLRVVFSSAQMATIFELVNRCSCKLVTQLQHYSDANKAVNVQDVLARFTTDVIGNVILGMECDTIGNFNLDILSNGKKMTKRSTWNRIIRDLVPRFPKSLVNALHLRLSNREAVEFFQKLTQENIGRRERCGTSREDILEVLLELRNKASESQEYGNGMSNDTFRFTSEDVVSHMMLFYGAGFETSAAVSAFTLYELAKNRDVQSKLRNEIDCALAGNDQYNYDLVDGIGYLDNCINEAMRRHSAATTFLRRRCVKNYAVKDSNLVIERGTRVWFPMSGFGADPEYFPDPDRYDPERFNSENRKNRPNVVFLPFGDGRRKCIGFRFGLLQVKVGILEIIRNFELSLRSSSSATLEHATETFVPSPKDGVWVHLKRLNNNC
ncbi:cytochrome P450 6a8-like isoform X2 [Cylas formicarius]|uniref:cytochrome P450 6a8-like isoform X2 n=1 Tax=Cylas formicarius TaxID=197179 RepID=UPI002958351D|nr:cytochrome P450 6a8-like isoform X2 [Cylas formicarius]